jgi:hypothetical protein
MLTTSRIYDKPGAVWSKIILTIILKIISKGVTMVMRYKTKKTTTPQQFEEDHIQLMTMRFIKVV